MLASGQRQGNRGKSPGTGYETTGTFVPGWGKLWGVGAVETPIIGSFKKLCRSVYTRPYTLVLRTTTKWKQCKRLAPSADAWVGRKGQPSARTTKH